MAKKQTNPFKAQSAKNYLFNETGNIMLSTTSTSLPNEIKNIFLEVSVFFAAMTRAISTTINPQTGELYSLYNYTALKRIISGSDLFIHATEEDLSYKTSQWGDTFSKELYASAMGLPSGAGNLSFAPAMIAAMGKEALKISGSGSKTDSKVGNIVFVCEYLLGMPLISAIVVSADVQKLQRQLSIGPCLRDSPFETEWPLHKETYSFVTPELIRKYGGDLASISSDPKYVEMIAGFSKSLK